MGSPIPIKIDMINLMKQIFGVQTAQRKTIHANPIAAVKRSIVASVRSPGKTVTREELKAEMEAQCAKSSVKKPS